MNIALLIDELRGGGSERVVRRLALGLAQRGHRVFVYCLRQAGIPLGPLTSAGVVVREARSVALDPLLPWRLGRWLRSDRIAVAHAHSCAALVSIFPAARLLGVPLVHVWHGWPAGSPTKYHRLAIRLDRFVTRVGANSQWLCDRLASNLRARPVTYLPNGIDLQPLPAEQARTHLRQLCGLAPHTPIVLNVGNIRPEKDTLGLLRAFALLRRDVPTATLVCVGEVRDETYWSDVCRLRDELGLTDAAHFPGPCEDAWRLMAGADVLCMSSQTESLPNVVLEGLSQRVPIVATAVGDVGRLNNRAQLGNTEEPRASARAATRQASRRTITYRGASHLLLQHGVTGLLAPPNDSATLAAALSCSLRDQPAAHERAARGHADYQRRFTTQRMVRRYEALYAECAGRRPRPTPRRPRVLMLGPAAPQVGGMVTSIDLLMRSPLRTRAELYRCATPAPAKGMAGRLTWLVSAAARHMAALRQLARTIRRRRIDLVHIHTCSYVTYYRNLLDLAVARLMGCTVLWHIRGGQFDRFAKTASPLGRWLIRRGMEAAAGVIVLSDHWQTALGPHVGQVRLHVVSNAVELPPISKRTGGEHPCRFLYLAPLTVAKGLADLISATAVMRQADIDFRLTIAGPATDEPLSTWAQRVRAAGLHDVTEFTGLVGNDERARLMAQSDCFVHPSHSEGLPNAILEAAAAGLPVVTSAVGSVPEIMSTIGDESLVPPRDVPALTSALRTMALDGERRLRVGRKLRRHMETHFSPRRLSDDLWRIYARVLDLPPHRPAAWLTRHLIYPAHERLRGRRTIAEMHDLSRVARLPRVEVDQICTDRLQQLLLFAAEHLPYYADLFAQRGVDPHGSAPLAELAKLPILHKAEVRANAQRMTYPGVPGGLQPCVSGGTSGDTLHFFVDRVRQSQSMGARLAMQEQLGVRLGERRIWLWGSPIEMKTSRIRRWRDRLLGEVMIDAFAMSPERIDAYLKQIIAYQPRLIMAYTSAAALLAQHAAQRFGPNDFPWLRAVVMTGDEVRPEQREIVSRTFGCPAVSEYGSREVGLIAYECPHGRLHVITPHVLVEITRGEQRVPPGTPGNIICTNLNTRAQPLIRYHLGDVGSLPPDECPCRLPFPVLDITGARITGFVALPGKRLCHGHLLAYIVRADPCVVEFRVHQRELDVFEVLLVVDETFTPAVVDGIKHRFTEQFGAGVTAHCRLVDEIPPDPSGKRRHVISDVAPKYSTFEVVS